MIKKESIRFISLTYGKYYPPDWRYEKEYK